MKFVSENQIRLRIRALESEWIEAKQGVFRNGVLMADKNPKVRSLNRTIDELKGLLGRARQL